MDETTSLLKLYEETGKLVHTFLEWRYKVMNRFFLMIAAIFFSIQWMYTNEVLKKFIFIILAIGMIFSILTALMDTVNSKTIIRCYHVAADAEQKLFSEPGIYCKLRLNLLRIEKGKEISYRAILKFMYWGSALIFLISSIYTFIKLY